MAAADTPLHVAVAVIEDGGRILLARRPPQAHQGDRWEFPGGKVEPGETVVAALARELEEELGITPRRYRPLLRLRHDYPERAVRLDVWKVTAFDGVPEGREGQPLRWVTADALPHQHLPDANRPIVTAVRLPDHLIIPPPELSPGQLRAALPRVATPGGLLILRCPHLPPDDYHGLARRVVAACAARGCRVLLTSEAAAVRALGAAGLHLSSRRLMALRARPHLPPGAWLSAACHDVVELDQAGRCGVDLALLSPVQPTTSHPGAPALGWRRFAELAERATMPVYALGGLGWRDIPLAWQRGGQGVAGIRAFWPVPGGAVHSPQ